LQSGFEGSSIRVPRCQKNGDFDTIQCEDEKAGRDCWCVDEYGVEFDELFLKILCYILDFILEVKCNIYEIVYPKA